MICQSFVFQYKQPTTLNSEMRENCEQLASAAFSVVGCLLSSVIFRARLFSPCLIKAKWSFPLVYFQCKFFAFRNLESGSFASCVYTAIYSATLLIFAIFNTIFRIFLHALLHRRRCALVSRENLCFFFGKYP